ncbi:M56 family metallopeptidase [Pedobacter agri]|uniref:M56 family metallopeptidase n=1 Tax=Pedobacter agri TaxID=454586 RepID=UPI002931EB16|nr:M56 family metallopeptidase [Pedobacter agri]
MKDSLHFLLAYILGSDLFQAWAFMLLHSVWQGLLLHMVAVLLLRYGKRMGAALRYNLLLFLFFVYLLACGCTLALQLGTAPTRLILNLPGPNTGSVLVDPLLPLVTFLWLIAFLIRSGRFGWDLINSHRLARAGNGKTDPYWQHRLDQLALKLRISGRIRLLESPAINVPAIIGLLKPIILMPMGVLASMPADQLEAVLLHELAHIRRKDYLVNLIQVTAEAIFFFNPALKWLSVQIRIEREHCCDDIALSQINKHTFVQALVSFQEHSLYRRSFPLAFTGQNDQLLVRVSRIIGHPISSSRHARWCLLVYMLPLLLMGWFFLNNAIFPLQHSQMISRFISSKPLRKKGLAITSNAAPVPQSQLIAKKEVLGSALSVVQHTDAESSVIQRKDSISSISSAPQAVTAINEVVQSEYSKEMQAYGERMVLYKKEIQAYSEQMAEHNKTLHDGDEQMVLYKKTLQYYNEGLVQYKKTLQDYNERIRHHLDDLPVKPPD